MVTIIYLKVILSYNRKLITILTLHFFNPLPNFCELFTLKMEKRSKRSITQNILIGLIIMLNTFY